MSKEELLILLLDLATEVEKEEDCSQCRAHDDHEICDRPNIAEAIRLVVERNMSHELFEYLRLERELVKSQLEAKKEEIRCQMDNIWWRLTDSERGILRRH